MRFAKHFALLLISILPWYTLSISLTACESKKICDYTKEIATAVKDMTLQTNNLMTILGDTVKTSDVMTIASYVMPIAGFFGAGLGLTSFILSKQQADEVKAAVEKLSKKMDVLSIKIDNGIHKVIAHQDHKQFQNHVSLPAQILKKKFFDFGTSFLQEDRTKLRKECKKSMPINIFDKMEMLLRENSDNILFSHQYTDEAFASYVRLHSNTMVTLSLLNGVCEELVNAKDTNVAEEIIQQNRLQKLYNRLRSVSEIMQDINSTREEKVWNRIIPTEVNRLYSEFGQLPFKERKKKEFAKEVVHKLNSDYSQFEHHFSFGVIKNRKSLPELLPFKRTIYHFACGKDVCHKKVADDYIVWILRSKRCRHGKEEHSSPNACLQFEAELYNRYDTNGIVITNATNALSTFMKNCHIENAIALFDYKKRLRGDSAGKAPVFRENIYEKLFNLKTEDFHRPFSPSRNLFDNGVFWTECPKNNQTFDFYNAYCKAGTNWPSCVLTEEAFMHHQLIDAPPPSMEQMMVHKTLELSTEQPEISENMEISEISENMDISEISENMETPELNE